MGNPYKKFLDLKRKSIQTTYESCALFVWGKVLGQWVESITRNREIVLQSLDIPKLCSQHNKAYPSSPFVATTSTNILPLLTLLLTW
jgi:hypothetical protein